uniref:Receptor-like serine/threonine-protein kinase n=1 Tax=Populus trichocarpa TaxID=3694 RepID=A0A3N7FBU8_POPTR
MKKKTDIISWKESSHLTSKLSSNKVFVCVNKRENTSMGRLSEFFACSFLFFILTTCTTPVIINPSNSITDGETLVSAGGSFELGFFNPGSSNNQYLGIWYVKSPEPVVVWVANREVPLSNKFGALNISSQGVLVIYSSTNDIVWSSNPSRTAEDPVAELLESGNLVVREGNDNNPDNFLWQSFDYPCDTLLPGMKLGFNLVTRLDRFLSSWKSDEDPARGEFTFLVDPNNGYPQLLLKSGNAIQLRTKLPSPTPNITFGQNSTDFVLNNNEVSFGNQSSGFSRFKLSPSGLASTYKWNDRTHSWLVYSLLASDWCENYALCGSFASCDINASPACGCLDGFVPKSPESWNLGDWSGGCIRKTPLNCSDKDVFTKYTVSKLPETSFSWFDERINLKECEVICLKNCFCTAYANSDIKGGGSGCLIWSRDLIDIRGSDADGQVLYVRLAVSESGVAVEKGNNNGKKKAGIIASTVVFGMGMLMLGMIFCIRRRKFRMNDNFKDVRKEDMEFPIFYLSTVANATGNFSSRNKLGEGGFGPVYKGILAEGQEIAVKRLSKSSGQGLNEFKNEVILIAKLQHRNLVKLLGYCIHEDEKMLIYEYMPNKSLDFFIFDKKKITGLEQVHEHYCWNCSRASLSPPRLQAENNP